MGRLGPTSDWRCILDRSFQYIELEFASCTPTIMDKISEEYSIYSRKRRQVEYLSYIKDGTCAVTLKITKIYRFSHFGFRLEAPFGASCLKYGT